MVGGSGAEKQPIVLITAVNDLLCAFVLTEIKGSV